MLNILIIIYFNDNLIFLKIKKNIKYVKEVLIILKKIYKLIRRNINSMKKIKFFKFKVKKTEFKYY